jgi:MazG family protein
VSTTEDNRDIEGLLSIIRRLLAPDGCPWDREQTLASLRPFLLEEVYEVLDAIDEEDPAHHREELGDLLFHVVFQAELAGHSVGDVIQGICDKLVRRHPHVFGDTRVDGTQQVLANWERIKQNERDEPGGLLSGIPRAMPALPRAQRLSTRAAKVGFDWPDAASVREKVVEELGELDGAIASGDPRQMTHELGDLLFALVNLARKLELDPEEALRRANHRFVRRFGAVEVGLQRRGKTPAESSLEEMEAMWQAAKQEE